MNEKRTCCATVYPSDRWGGLHGYICGKSAKICVDGKWYCGIHAPASVKARKEKSEKKWEEKRARWEEEARRHDAISALVSDLTTDEIEALVKQKKQKDGGNAEK